MHANAGEQAGHLIVWIERNATTGACAVKLTKKIIMQCVRMGSIVKTAGKIVTS